MVARVIGTFEPLDILINNAGVNIRKPIEDFDEVSWDLARRPISRARSCARAVARHTKARGYGKVINVG